MDNCSQNKSTWGNRGNIKWRSINWSCGTTDDDNTELLLLICLVYWYCFNIFKSFHNKSQGDNLYFTQVDKRFVSLQMWWRWTIIIFTSGVVTYVGPQRKQYFSGGTVWDIKWSCIHWSKCSH